MLRNGFELSIIRRHSIAIIICLRGAVSHLPQVMERVHRGLLGGVHCVVVKLEVWLSIRVSQKKRNMQCVAVQRMQVVVHYCDQYATKIRVFRSLSNFSHPF